MSYRKQATAAISLLGRKIRIGEKKKRKEKNKERKKNICSIYIYTYKRKKSIDKHVTQRSMIVDVSTNSFLSVDYWPMVTVQRRPSKFFDRWRETGRWRAQQRVRPSSDGLDAAAAIPMVEEIARVKGRRRSQARRFDPIAERVDARLGPRVRAHQHNTGGRVHACRCD